MNIKKIILEEIDSFDWVKDIPVSNPFQIGGFNYFDGEVIPWDVITLGDAVRYRGGDSFMVEKIHYNRKTYDNENIHTLPQEASNHNNMWALTVWGSNQPYPYLDSGEHNWYDGGKAIKVNGINESNDFDWADDMTDDIKVGTCIKLHQFEYICLRITDEYFIMKIKNPKSKSIGKKRYKWNRTTVSKYWSKEGMTFCDINESNDFDWTDDIPEASHPVTEDNIYEGMRVRIVDTSDFYEEGLNGDIGNPVDVTGTITNSFTGHPTLMIEVDWDNDESNSYNHTDLITHNS